MRVDGFLDEGLSLEVQNENVLGLRLDVVQRVKPFVLEPLHHCLAIVFEVRLADHWASQGSRPREDRALGHVDVVEEQSILFISLCSMIDSRQVEVVEYVGFCPCPSSCVPLVGHRHLFVAHLSLLHVVVVVEDDLGVVNSARAREVVLLLALFVEELDEFLFDFGLKLVDGNAVV